jgi:PAS domain S-box-containing protein
MSTTDFVPLQKLWEDLEFILSREASPSDSESRLVLSPVSDQPSPATIRRLEYLHSLREKLDPSFFTRPLGIAWQNGQLALWLEDPGVTLLEQTLGRPLKLKLALKLGVGIASVLGRLHTAGFIHGSLNANSVFVHPASGEARLFGAYISPRSIREVAAEPPEPGAVNWAGLAPEQTGRTNRATDSRTDLYRYGVMLYRMVTGVAPFTAADPIEWIHCLLAVQPMPPNERAKGIPAQLSAIIMKLLAKMPEARYQTAAGVEKDLKRCLESLESGRKIAPFPLGAHDIPDQLFISEKLYGRDSEIETVISAFKRVASEGRAELLLVSGHSGIGKTTVVNQLPRQYEALGGLFASGKFDQYKEDIPYTTVAQAFQTLVRQILRKSNNEVRQWQERITEALGGYAGLISNLLPELDAIVGKQPPVPALPLQDARNVFKMVFRRFVGVFARPEHPLVLFLDDLQWADAGTLGLLEHLLTEPDVHHLLIIGAYRDNEVDSAHPLNRTLEKLQDTGVAVCRLPLAPLALSDVTEFLVDTLRSNSGRTKQLAQLICEKTGGNPLFIIEFFKALAEEKLLVFDPAIQEWTWNLEQIASRDSTANIEDLVLDKIGGLAAATQQVLRQLACLGSRASISAIHIASGQSEQMLDAELEEAMRAGLVVLEANSVRFTHDWVQEAAYQLIPETGRALEHLRIGRLLLDHLSANDIEGAIFEIVNQLNRGLAHVHSRDERNRLIELNILAGKRAKVAAAYVSALSYLTVSHELLGSDQSKYETAFSIGLDMAECELLTGQVAAADQRLSRLSILARNFQDRIAVARLRVVLYTTSDRVPRAIEVCLECLQSIGLACPQNPTDDEIGQEYERIWAQLGDRAVEDLADLAPMTDATTRAALELITAVVPPSWFTFQNVRDLLTARMVNLSLEHGNSDASCYAYAVLGRTLGSRFGDYQTGYRFGKLSLKLLDKHGSDRFKTRVYTCFGHHIDPWNRHLKHARESLELVSTAAPEAGDLAFTSFHRSNMLANLLAGGEPLVQIQKEAEIALQFARKIGFGLIADFLLSMLACVRALRGLTEDIGSFDSPDFDEAEFEKHLDRDLELSAAKFRYWMRKLQAYFYAGNCAAAVAAAAKVQELGWQSQSFLEVAEYCWFTVLAQAGLFSYGTEDERKSCLNAIAVHRKLIGTWSQNCPENFRSIEALVEAEVARIEGRDLDAESLYETSLNSARENRFVHHEAIANELAGKFYLRRGLLTVAQTYLRNARYCYLYWGAAAKVRQLDRQYPDLTENRLVSLPDASIDTVANRLDSAAIVKALQAISGEIVLGKLIKTLMQIAVEHAAAERGLFLLASENALQIEAEAATINGQVEVILYSGEDAGTTTDLKTVSPGVGRSRMLLDPMAAPVSVLQHVLRTHEGIMLEDASARSLFPDDEYLCQRRPKSVLCMPIVRQDRVIGILYLENNLTTLDFTAYRIHVLKLLASQAAISLENARLYTNLRKSQEKYRDLIEVSPDAIFVIDTDLTYVSANLAGAKLAGCTEEELIGRPLTETFSPEEWSLLPFHMETLKKAPYRRFETEFVRRNGDIVPVEVSLTAVRGRYLQAVVRDISERKRAEEALRVSEQLARGQVEALIYSLDVLATASEPEKYLGRMLSTICRQLSGQSAALWLYDESAESMTLQLLADSRGTLDFQENHQLAVGPLSWGKNSGYQELIFAACPILCEDVATDPRLCGEMRDYFLMIGAKKFLAVPILAEGRVRGMITVRHAARLPYRTEEVELAQALAHQVMLAIRLTEVGDQTRQAAVLAERNRMARDVHDTLAQGFTGVIVQLEAAEYAISEGDREDADQHLRQAGELARSSLSEARRSVHALRPQALEEVNFWEALKRTIKSTTIGTTLQTRFETKGEVPVLPSAWQENLLRIGQEALSNTLKYARAKQFRVQFTSSAKQLRMELSDDGDGFRVNERHDGVGLTGMRERVQEMGGELQVLSSPGKGTKIKVILPTDAVRRLVTRPS